METDSKREIEILIGAQYGDSAGHTVFGPPRRALLEAISEFVKSPATDQLERIYLTLRVDGGFIAWGELGCKRLRFQKLRRYISIDLCFTSESWTLPDADVEKLFLQFADEGFQLVVGRLKKERIALDFEQLLGEWDQVKEKYRHEYSS
jgi:hypothetical protein